MQALGGATKVKGIGHGKEIAEMPEFHRPTSY
jgi:hypothetical protein